jgi:hypothetical protein
MTETNSPASTVRERPQRLGGAGTALERLVDGVELDDREAIGR